MTLATLLKKHLRAAVHPGAHIDDLDGQTTYAISAGGMSGVMTEYDSPPHRYRVDFSLGPIAYTVADDGKTGWERDASGNIRILRGAELAENRAAQNFSLETYDPIKGGKHTKVLLRPGRDKETGDYVLDVTSTDGTPQTLFLNPHTYLVDEIIAHKGGMAGTVHIRKYREVSGVMVPALLEIGYAGMPLAVTATLQSARQGVTLNPAVFRAPQVQRDYEFLVGTGHTSAIIPFTTNDNEIVIPVTINGKERKFILDSGAGSSFITADAANEVGLTTQGNLAAIGYGGAATTGIAAKTTVQIADAVKISGLPLYVVHDEGVAKMLNARAGVDGALGYDVFARFTVTIDYRRHLLTLAAPGSTAQAVTASARPIRLPIRMEMHTPTIVAAVDGKKTGQFLVDTGDSGTVHLFDRYAEANGLKAKFGQPGATVHAGLGVGGLMMEITTPNHAITMAGHTIKPIPLATIAGKGINGASELAGGIGNGILSKFLVTVDYDSGQITLLPADAAKPAPPVVPAPAPGDQTPPAPAAPSDQAAPAPAAPGDQAAPAPAAPGDQAAPPIPDNASPVETPPATPTDDHATPANTDASDHAAPAAAGAPSDLTLGQLLARHLKALGGYKAVEAIKTTRVFSTVSTGGESGTVLSIYQSPDKEFEEDKLGLMDVRQGYDGHSAWQLDSNGNLRPLGGDEVRDLVNQIFFDTNSYVIPGKRKGKISLRKTREAGTGDYVVDVFPDGGKPCSIYLDPKTYLIVKEQHHNDDVTTTTFYSHYIRANGVAFPGVQTQTNGNSRYDLKLVVKKIENNVTVADSLFSPPATHQNYKFLKPGATSATVPFDFADGEIAFNATINGHPVRLLFDSGASTIALSADEADKLHLKQAGYLEARGYGGSVDLHPIQIDQFEIPGAVRIDHITGAAIPFAAGLGDLQHGEVMGFAGYDILSRFVIKIDYAHRKLTFIDPAAFKPSEADGTPIPATIEDDIPTVEASVDGYPNGRFLVDTGDVARLRLYGPFVSEHDLTTKYPRGVMSAGGGIGGRSDAREVKIGEVHVGDATLKMVPTELSMDTKGGASVLNAGSIGSGLLSRFVVTFDYPHSRIFLAKTAETDKPFETRVLGLMLAQEDRKSGHRIVVQDIEHSAPVVNTALQPGDQITAVDGRPIAGLGMEQVLALLKPRPGRNAVSLTVKTPKGVSHVIQAQYFDPLV